MTYDKVVWNGHRSLVDTAKSATIFLLFIALYANIEVMRLLFQVYHSPVNCNLIDSSLELSRRWHEIFIMFQREPGTEGEILEIDP
jgi:hypothetical protein